MAFPIRPEGADCEARAYCGRLQKDGCGSAGRDEIRDSKIALSSQQTLNKLIETVLTIEIGNFRKIDRDAAPFTIHHGSYSH